MAVFSHREFVGHEQVVFARDEDSGLRAIIAIHNTALGPALGGCRMWDYATEAEALTDVLRLSVGMSYKNALAGLPFGGGKAVILGDARHDKSNVLLTAFARQVQYLGGRYYTAEDVGIGPADVDWMACNCDYVVGRSGAGGSGDPSGWTARGVFVALREAVRARLGREDLHGVSVMVQGVGNVGGKLCEYLYEAGAELLISDVNQVALRAIQDRTGATIVPLAGVAAAEADVYAPCALGGVLNDESIPQLRATVVCGSANNQLAEPRHGRALHARGILYAPDYLVNAGGVINVSAEVGGEYDAERVRQGVEGIADTARELFALSVRRGKPTAEVVDELVHARLETVQPLACSPQALAAAL